MEITPGVYIGVQYTLNCVFPGRTNPTIYYLWHSPHTPLSTHFADHSIPLQDPYIAFEPDAGWYVTKPQGDFAGVTSARIGARTNIPCPVLDPEVLSAPGEVHTVNHLVSGVPLHFTIGYYVYLFMRYETLVMDASVMPANDVMINSPFGMVPESYSEAYQNETAIGLFSYYDEAGDIPGYHLPGTLSKARWGEHGPGEGYGYLSNPATSAGSIGGGWGSVVTMAYYDVLEMGGVLPALDLTMLHLQLRRDYGSPPPTALLESSGEASSGVAVRVTGTPAQPLGMMGAMRLTRVLQVPPAPEPAAVPLTRPRVGER